ncbi:MAG TPA: TolC family protein [Gemmatimonadales bacterium]|nr:TolC family protein [Gemmatimonadales bacterium]
MKTKLMILWLPLLTVVAAPVSAQAQQPARQLSLEQALSIARNESEAVGVARAGIEAARGEQRRARSEFFPQLNGSLSYTRTLETQFAALTDEESGDSTPVARPSFCPTFIPNPGAPPEERLAALEDAVECSSALDPFASFADLPFGQPNQWSFGLSLSQNLFAGGRILAQNRIASANRRRAETELTAQEAQLVLDVTTAYYDAVLSDRLVTIAEASLTQAERTLKDVRLARQVGTQPEFDLLRAEVARDNQRPVVIQRRTARDLAYLRLAQMLNLPLDQPVALTTELGDTAAAEGPLAVPIAAAEKVEPDTAIGERAPVRQAEENVRASQGQLAVARSQSLPAVVLSSQYAKLNFPEDPLPSGQFLTDWTIGVSLQLPLFTGGRLSGERMIARAGLEQARLRLRQTEEQARLDARNTVATGEEAEARWAASTGTVRQAQRAYQIAEIRYREGISTQTELSDSRLQLQEAQANRAQAARDLQVARVRLALLKDLPLEGATGTPPVLPAAPASRAAPVPVPVTPGRPGFSTASQ